MRQPHSRNTENVLFALLLIALVAWLSAPLAAILDPASFWSATC